MSFSKLLVCAALALNAVAIPALAEERTVVEVEIAPPDLRVEPVPEPRRGYVWVPGYWEWRNRHHVWISGRWLRERKGYHWVPDGWVEHNGRWHREYGRWER